MIERIKFRDRTDAGSQLAAALQAYKTRQPLVLGIPRGGVVPAEILARELEGDLDVALVRKLRAPGDPELAVGSITESGQIYVNDRWKEILPDAYLKAEAEEALALLRQRRATYTPGQEPIDVRNRVIIVVDDGIATGATMIAALHSLRDSGAAKLVAAAAVAPPDTAQALCLDADEVVVLQTPEPFRAVSLWFDDFAQVTDDEVIALLRKSPRRTGPPPNPADELHHGNFGLHRGKGRR